MDDCESNGSRDGTTLIFALEIGILLHDQLLLQVPRAA
jgi:hypothetical protein